MGLLTTLKKKIRLFNNNNIIGLDIGDQSIKLAEVSTNKQGIVLNNLAISPVPEGAVKNGDLDDIIKLEGLLRQLLKEKEFQARKVVAAISGEQVISRMIDVPVMPIEELAAAIKWEASEKLPIRIEDVVLEYEILSQAEDDRYQVLLIAVNKKLINKYLTLFKSLELEPVAIEIEPAAIARTIGRLGLAGTIGVIDIGTNTTDISILDKGKLLFTRNIGLGGESITNDIAEMQECSFEEAESYKISTNLFEQEDINLIIRNLTTSIYRSLDYFQVQYRGFDIDKLIITGGGANLIGFAEYLSKEFEISVDKLNLLGYLSSEVVSDKYLSEVEQLLGVSIGLALREDDEK